MATVKRDRYIPALKYRWLTRFYDPVVAMTTREGVFRPKLLDQAMVRENDRVLDLACGTGTFAAMIKERYPGVVVTGLDGDAEILGQARKKAQAFSLDIEFDEGMSWSMPYPDGAFDIVFSSLFFHHLTRTDKERTMREVHRILKPGGGFHVCDWGPPSNAISTMTFTAVRLLDGFGVTRDNIDGYLPFCMKKTDFRDVRVTGHVGTLLGTLELLAAEKPVR